MTVNEMNEKRQAVYASKTPLLDQIRIAHQISYREFASLMGISKSHAEDILKHRQFPKLEVAVKMARYFEVTVEDLFAWRIEDDGKRRPLLVFDPRTKKLIRLDSGKKEHGALILARGVER